MTLLLPLIFFDSNLGQFYFQTPKSNLSQDLTQLLSHYLDVLKATKAERNLLLTKYIFIPKDNAKALVPHDGLTLA